jgi:hypothetical protein
LGGLSNGCTWSSGVRHFDLFFIIATVEYSKGALRSALLNTDLRLQLGCKNGFVELLFNTSGHPTTNFEILLAADTTSFGGTRLVTFAFLEDRTMAFKVTVLVTVATFSC